MLNADAIALLDRLAHDLRAPLHSILAIAELVQTEVYAKLPPELREPLADLEAEGRRMQELIEETLDLVRLSAGRYRPEPSLCRLEALLEAIAFRYGARVTGARELRQDPAKVTRLCDRLLQHCARTAPPLVEIGQSAIRISPAGETTFDPLAAPAPLGPAVARALARLLGGDVVLEGDAFVVTLPAL